MNQDKNKSNKIIIKKKESPEIIPQEDKDVNLNKETPLEENKKTSPKIQLTSDNKKLLFGGFGLVVVALICYGLYSMFSSQGNTEETAVESIMQTDSELDTLKMTLQKSYTINEFLLEYKVPSADIPLLERQAIQKGFETFSISDKIEILNEKSNGKLYAIEVIPKAMKEKKFVFNIDKVRFIAERREVEKVTRSKYVVIDSSLFEAVIGNNLPYNLIQKMEDVLGYTIDFFHLKKGDWFRVIYEEKIVDGELLGVDNIKAIVFSNDGIEYDAYSYPLSGQLSYFDNFGKTLTKKFLMSPLQYGKLTSAFNLERLHPVTGVLKPHFGTDYAAPEGTPILTVADGVIIKQEQTSNNGNYVKVKHDNTYETQYLHMSAFVQGLKEGSRVKQGQVIGFVGQTGLATGPHVCFRFWKNGVQVDHRKEKLPSSGESLPQDNKTNFDTRRDSLIQQLKAISG